MPSYDFACPSCSRELCARPSLLMSMGINQGGGKCLECGQLLMLSIADDNSRMIAAAYVAPEVDHG